mmetsp:Transcript_9171/g.16581  ORF Transcript_9171/g.16581 Transcript_9171/m.16581 type:complete len:259 (+) Transcript_9171:766-1542(+)
MPPKLSLNVKEFLEVSFLIPRISPKFIIPPISPRPIPPDCDMPLLLNPKSCSYLLIALPSLSPLPKLLSKNGSSNCLGLTRSRSSNNNCCCRCSNSRISSFCWRPRCRCCCCCCCCEEEVMLDILLVSCDEAELMVPHNSDLGKTNSECDASLLITWVVLKAATKEEDAPCCPPPSPPPTSSVNDLLFFLGPPVAELLTPSLLIPRPSFLIPRLGGVGAFFPPFFNNGFNILFLALLNQCFNWVLSNPVLSINISDSH